MLKIYNYRIRIHDEDYVFFYQILLNNLFLHLHIE